MSMQIDLERNELIFLVPNSEAPMEAQHKGIADRTVGSFYMSDRYQDCYDFLNRFQGEFYIDISLCINNAKKVVSILKENRLEASFKQNLILQQSSIEALEWYSKIERTYYYRILPPTVNDQKKYLKLDNFDEIYKLIKTFLLGDLSRLIFKKIGFNGFVIYIDFIDSIDKKIEDGSIAQWSRK